MSSVLDTDNIRQAAGYGLTHWRDAFSGGSIFETRGEDGELVDQELGDPLDLFGIEEEAAANAAAEEAASTQEDAAMAGLEEARRQFDISQANMQPWLDAGTGALGEQSALAGLSGLEAQNAAFDRFRADPGQALMQQRGQDNLLAGASAIGGLGGGNVRSDLVQQGVNFGQQDFANYYNRLAGISGTGQTTGQQMGQQGAQFANAAGGFYGQAGQARASGILGQQQNAAARQQQTVQLASTIGSFFMSEEKSKKNINDLDLKECYENMMSMPLKSWEYLQEAGLEPGIHFGPMIDKAPKMITQGNKISLHDEIMMIAGAMQYMKNEGMLSCR